jgi:hypothetical protein
MAHVANVSILERLDSAVVAREIDEGVVPLTCVFNGVATS